MAILTIKLLYGNTQVSKKLQHLQDIQVEYYSLL